MVEDLIKRQAARIAELEAAIRKQANAARSLADATIRDASIRQGLAEKAYAESSPEVLASERQANAMLTEENERLTARLTALESERDALLNSIAAARQDASTAWERHAMATRIGNAEARELATARGLIAELKAERDALLAAAGKEAVGQAGAMPGTDGFTMACFKASDVPIGTPLYTAPTAAQCTMPVASFVLLMLVAAGHVSQAKVDEAIAIARKTPGVDAAALEKGDGRDAEKMIADLEAEQTYIASSRETCSRYDVPRWDRIQAVIDHLKTRGA